MGIPLSIGRMTPGNLWAAFQQSYLPGRPTWSEQDIPDLTGHVALVTGANSGLGKETVRALLEHGATVYMACRSREKAEAVIAELHILTRKKAILLEMDLADLMSIKRAATEFLSKETQLHILFNNGGIMVPPVELLTADGYDLTFGTNVLGHFYLTKLLLPALTAATASNPSTGRVVNLTSVSHYVAIPNYNTFKDGPARKRMHPIDLYTQSKWANAVFSAELARRYGDQGIISTAVNPGNLRTDLSRDASGFAWVVTSLLMIWPVEWGVLGQLWVGTSAEGAHLNGKYISPWGRISRPGKDVDDPQTGKELWTWLEDQVQGI